MFKNIDKNWDKVVEIMEEYDTYLSDSLSIIKRNEKYTAVETFNNICIFPTTNKFDLRELSQYQKKHRPFIEVYLGRNNARMKFWGISTYIDREYRWDGYLAYGIRFPRITKYDLKDIDKIEDRIIKEAI